MSRRMPLHSPEGRRLVEQGPPWREHPDYYAEEPDEDIPWHTEDQVKLSVTRMKNWAAQNPRVHVSLGDETWENLARVSLGMRPR